ncbi:MAG: trypsin-like peptidase domain-containing protein, partial [Pseudomonadota bacterium]
MQQLTRFIVLPALVGALLGLLIMWFLSDSQASAKPGYAAAVARATPAVVNIQTRTIRVDNPLCRFYRGLCEAFPSRAQQSLGSGVILRSDGYILTNEHVVGGADEILVMFANGQVVTAEVIGSDLHTDLAVIKVAANGLPVIPQAEADDIQVGDIALAIGNPFGLGHSVSQGIVSALARASITRQPYDDFIQTDAAISPGNSGGALVDYRGRLLGINTMIVSQSGGSEGIGFAIPVDIAGYVLDEIVANGRVIRGWLGVTLSPNFTSGGINGLRVEGVARGGPAHRAGIQAGDVVMSINQLTTTSPHSVPQLISRTRPGET